MGAVVDADLEPGRINYGIVTMRLEDGTMGYYEAGWDAPLHSGNVKQFIGDQGHITLTMQATRSTHVEMGDLIEVYHASSDTYEQINVEAIYKDMWGQLSSLIDRIEGRPTDAPTIEEAYSAFRVALAAIRQFAPTPLSALRISRKQRTNNRLGLSRPSHHAPITTYLIYIKTRKIRVSRL